MTRWDAHTAALLPAELRNRLGIAIARSAYSLYGEILESERWQQLAREGAWPQRLLWASTGAKDPRLRETYYVSALAAEGTVNTMPENTLLAFEKRGEVGAILARDPSEADWIVAEVEKAGVDVGTLAATLLAEGCSLFVESWDRLLTSIESKASPMQAA